MSPPRLLPLALTLSLVAAGAARASGYAGTALGTLGGPTASASAINASGQIGGRASVSSSSYHAAIWTQGNVADLGVLAGGTKSAVSALNDAGQAAGFSNLTDGSYHAVLFSAGQVIDLGEGPASFANGIDSAGRVVGVNNDQSSTAYRAFLWQNGASTDLGDLGGGAAYAYSVSAAGVVGLSTVASGVEHAFFWQGGSMQDLGTLPGDTTSWAVAINDSGQIVGNSTTASGPCHAFLWQNGTMTALPPLSGAQSVANGISPSGLVIGSSLSGNTLWTNGVPENLNAATGDLLGYCVGVNNAGMIACAGQVANANVITFLVAPVSMISLGISADKSSYTTGSTAQLSGSVTLAGAPFSGAGVSIRVATPGNGTALSVDDTLANGSFVSSFSITKRDGTGTYSVSATAQGSSAATTSFLVTK